MLLFGLFKVLKGVNYYYYYYTTTTTTTTNYYFSLVFSAAYAQPMRGLHRFVWWQGPYKAL